MKGSADGSSFRSAHWNVDLAGHPESMEQNGEFPGDGYDCSFAPAFATNACMLKTPAPQIGVRTAVAEDVLRAIDQQLAQVSVAGLGDPESGRVFA